MIRTVKTRLFIPVLGVISGICWQILFPPPSRPIMLGLYAFFAIMFSLAAIFLSQETKIKKTALVSLFFCIGSIGLLTDQILFITSKNLLKNAESAIALIEDCQETQTTAEPRFKIQVKIKQLKNDDAWYTIFYPARLILIKSKAAFDPGQTIFINLKKLILIDSQKKADLLPCFVRNSIFLSAIPKKWAIKRAFKEYSDLDRLIILRSHEILEKTQKKLSPLSSKLYSSIFLGKKTINFDDCDKELFCNWGLAHFLARSGLHLTIFTSIILGALRFIPFIPIQAKGLTTLLLLIIYLIFSWSSISFLRSFYMLAIVVVGNIFGQKSNSLHLVSLVCLWILFSNPYELFCADFQLSFGLTFALIFSTNFIKKDNFTG